jgi:malic enzyme
MELNAEMIAAIAAAVKAATPAKKAKGKGKKAGPARQKLTDEQKAANAVQNAAVAEKLFQDAGYENCVAHETIRTYDKWLEVGRRVNKGQKALRTPKGMALFHLDMTSPVAPAN